MDFSNLKTNNGKSLSVESSNRNGRRHFTPEYGEMKKFREDFKAALAKVLAVYRDAKVSFDRNGILQLRQSRPSVAKTPLSGK